MQGHIPAPDHNVPRVIETGVRIGVGYEYHTNTLCLWHMSSVAWTWRTNTYAMWHMSPLSWRIASYMRKMKEFFCSLHHFLVYIFTGPIEPLAMFLTNFGAMHLYIYSIQSHLYSKLLYILQNLMHTLAQPPIFGQLCCIF